MLSRPRIVVITNVLAPYRVEFYRRLCADPAFDVSFLFGGHPRLETNWALKPNMQIRGEMLSRVSFRGKPVWNPSLSRRLRALAPDLVVCVGASSQLAIALRYARPRHVPVLVWWGGTIESEAHVTGFKSHWRRWLFQRVDGFFLYSSFTGDYVRSVIGETKPMFILGNNTMDADAWRQRVSQARAAQQPKSEPVILGLGQLIPRKNYALAVKLVARLRDPVRLLLAGTGELAAALQEQARELGVESRVELVGDVAHDQLPCLLAQTRVFLHPATMDQWPQVINEAMSAGLPVILSRRSGVPADFARDGENCFVRDPADEDGWLNALEKLLHDDALTQRLGRAAAETAASRDIGYALEEFKRGVRKVLAQ
ncbi:MAG TPA: glycosyltransferase family 4 protein [Verrucomicrobiae bacterium]|nr:glycosyltransferase family 4 protein [Verrucomicrobiae bacterium]